MTFVSKEIETEGKRISDRLTDVLFEELGKHQRAANNLTYFTVTHFAARMIDTLANCSNIESAVVKSCLKAIITNLYAAREREIQHELLTYIENELKSSAQNLERMYENVDDILDESGLLDIDGCN
ncbi:MAG: hypothetical protein IJ549_02575 [Prevotella sp.]|nr:hypothetical protein [Prevotella sp.]